MEKYRHKKDTDRTGKDLRSASKAVKGFAEFGRDVKKAKPKKPNPNLEEPLQSTSTGVVGNQVEKRKCKKNLFQKQSKDNDCSETEDMPIPWLEKMENKIGNIQEESSTIVSEIMDYLLGDNSKITKQQAKWLVPKLQQLDSYINATLVENAKLVGHARSNKEMAKGDNESGIAGVRTYAQIARGAGGMMSKEHGEVDIKPSRKVVLVYPERKV